MGGNICNKSILVSYIFCQNLRELLEPDDLVIEGFALVNSPLNSRRANDDCEDVTKKFNLNLLERTN